MGFFVGAEVAAEGGVFDLKIVVALFEFLDRGDHRRDERRVFQREGFDCGGFQAARCYWIHLSFCRLTVLSAVFGRFDFR